MQYWIMADESSYALSADGSSDLIDLSKYVSASRLSSMSVLERLSMTNRVKNQELMYRLC